MEFVKKTIDEKGRNKLYLVLDCETATLPFADEIAKTAKQKQNIAIAKPLIYDIAWMIVDSKLNVYSRHSYLTTEIFSVPQVFNTAYYRDKRPIYLERLRNGETQLKTWNEITALLFDDLRMVNTSGAYNAMFDFKKAIPFTEQYIYHLYNTTYQEWEARQRQNCISIARGYKSKSEREFDPAHFNFKGIDFPIIDIWGIACEKLINNQAYKFMCLDNGMITESGKYFKTSAESTYRYLLKDTNFIEAHTAIDDVEIECRILIKALKRGKVAQGITYFPFQELGEVPQFLRTTKRGIKREHFDYVIQVMQEKLDTYENNSSFATQLQSSIWTLERIRDERF